MDKQRIWNGVKPIIEAYIYPSSTGDLKITDRLDVLGVDSLELAGIMTEAEKKFKIEFEDSDMWEVETCEDIVNTIYNEINAEKK